MKAVCQACGVSKTGPFVPCRTCGHVPVAEERPMAWLLSDHHLSLEEMEEAARRLRAGEILEPAPELLRVAVQEMRDAMPSGRRLPWETDDEVALGGPSASTAVPAPEWRPPERAWPGLVDPDGPPAGRLSRTQMEWLLLANVLLTPLFGALLWWTWRQVCPRAARQVLWVTLPTMAGLTLLWSVFVIGGWTATLR